ncbi:MAG: Tim44/TimA family putative adaptor protein [Alphaproteobacteria bacterium]
MGNIPLDLLIYAVIAVVLGFKLKGMLGKNIGHTQKMDDPLGNLSKKTQANNTKKLKTDNDDSDAEPAEDQTEGYLQHPSLALTLAKISNKDRDFDAGEFIVNATSAFEMAFDAFASNDPDTLEMLLTPDAFEGFDAALKEREAVGHICKDALLSISKTQITEVELDRNIAEITLLFVTEQINVTYDGNNNLIEGNGDAAGNFEEYWTFTRDLKSKDPAWLICATQSNHVED